MPEGAYPPQGPSEVDAAALRRIARRTARVSPWLHDEVARRMAERLVLVRRTPRVVADWFSRSDAARKRLTLAYPGASLWCVEPDDDLRCELAARSAPRAWLARRRIRVAPPDEVADGEAQLLWANMMLHGVADPASEMRRWHRVLQVDGFLMFSTVGPGTLRELRELYARLGWPPPHAPFIDMHDLGDMLVHSGFADPVMDQETLTLTWADAPAVLAELRSLGGNASPRRFAGLRTPRWCGRLLRELGTLAGPDGRLRMSFEIIYGHAFKGPPVMHAGEATQVPLADMRRMLRARRTSG